MGNHHSGNGGHKHAEVTLARSDSKHQAAGGGGSLTASRRNSSKMSLSRTTSGAEISEKATVLLPVEKLAKILTHKTHQEENISGVGLATFTKYLFPRYPILAEKLYHFFLANAGGKHTHLTTAAFKQQCDKLFAMMDDEAIRDYLVRMFADKVDGGEAYMITPEALQKLLMCAYHVAMDHYSEGPQMCLAINKTLRSVVDSCFHAKQQLSAQFVSHWLATNCPRLIVPLHRYAVHSLATSHRNLEENGPSLVAGLEMATPVLEHPPPFGDKPPHPHLLQMSASWLLAGALPPLYSRPQQAHSPSNSGAGIAGGTYLTKFLCTLPSHWINLYDSDEHGLGVNRFTHHVLAYKGPTLVLVKVERGQVFCIASPCEWRESHLYWGGEESAVFQLLPKFCLLEKGSKMLYLNTMVRGYPQGLRVGSDPRAPIITIDKGFEKFEFRKIPYALETIEVWGCGDQASRDVQLDIKKWQVKEAEKQRAVKLSAADWLDHPDRYLLELAGRPQYHQKQNQ